MENIVNNIEVNLHNTIIKKCCEGDLDYLKSQYNINNSIVDNLYLDKQLNEEYTLLKFAIEYNHINIVEWLLITNDKLILSLQSYEKLIVRPSEYAIILRNNEINNKT